MKKTIETDIYKELCEEISKNGVLTPAKEMEIRAYAAFQAIRADAIANIEKDKSAVQTFANKTSNVSGWFTALDRATNHSMKLAEKLGLYEKMRNDLTTMGKVTNKDERYLR